MNLTDQLSKYCTYGEGIRSETAERKGIINIPNQEQLVCMRYVATEIIDKIREHFGPLHINSFFRCPELNGSIYGSATGSQHEKGEAVDMSIVGLCKEIFIWVKSNSSLLDFDQMIWEYGTNEEPAWVHVSKVTRRPNRRQIIQAVLENGVPKYIPFNLF